MDAATTNKVLKNLSPNKVLSRMNLKNLRRKRSDNRGSSSIGFNSSSLATVASQRRPSGIKRVRFHSQATVVSTIQYYDPNTSGNFVLSPQDEQSLRWYSKQDLHAMFLKDLEQYLTQQVYGNITSLNGRGLELHLADNQRRKDQAERYVKAVVDKSYAIRKTRGGRRNIHKSFQQQQQQQQHDLWADELQQFALQYTSMTRDWALAEAAQDAAQAQIIYQEAPTTIEQEATATAPQRPQSTKYLSKQASSDSIISLEDLATTTTSGDGTSSPVSETIPHHRRQRNQRPRSFTAKSA